MSKHIVFKKKYHQVADDMMRVVVSEDGILLGYGGYKSVAEVKEWIKSQEVDIENKKDDIRCAERGIEIFKDKFESVG